MPTAFLKDIGRSRTAYTLLSPTL